MRRNNPWFWITYSPKLAASFKSTQFWITYSEKLPIHFCRNAAWVTSSCSFVAQHLKSSLLQGIASWRMAEYFPEAPLSFPAGGSRSKECVVPGPLWTVHVPGFYRLAEAGGNTAFLSSICLYRWSLVVIRTRLPMMRAMLLMRASK